MLISTLSVILFSGNIYGFNSLLNQRDCNNQNPKSEPNDTVKDIDGNIYHIVKISTQLWMKENLKVTRYNDGTAIPLIDDSIKWGMLNSPAYCWYANNPEKYKETYGALYNWFAAANKKLCPKGWHVSTDEDWIILTSSFGGENSLMSGEETYAANKLKETGTKHWHAPNNEADNKSGFTALPGGTRGGGNGSYRVLGSMGGWWTSTQAIPTYSWYRTINFDGPDVNRDFGHVQTTGFSIRCVKDK